MLSILYIIKEYQTDSVVVCQFYLYATPVSLLICSKDHEHTHFEVRFVN